MKKNTTRFTTAFAIVLSFLWVFGFVWSIQDYYYGKGESEAKVSPSTAEETSSEDKTIVALGDSLTRGTGDETGKGYVGLVSDQLKKKLAPANVTLYNLGIKGQTSSDLLQQVQQQQIGRQIAEADVILLTIGGNDLFQQGETLMNFNEDTFQQLQQQYIENLQGIFQTIRSQNSEATVFMLGLYNPFIELQDSETTNEVVRAWNYGTENTAAQFNQIVFVPTFDLFQLSVNEYLYSDNFHPNATGYKLIADRVAPLITLEKEAN